MIKTQGPPDPPKSTPKGLKNPEMKHPKNSQKKSRIMAKKNRH